MARAKFIIPVGQYQQRPGSGDAAAEKDQQIERGFIRPVHILENGNACALAQFFEHRRKDQAAVGIGFEQGR